jgi:hypothetical protein
MRTALGTSSLGVLLGALVALGSGCGQLEGDVEQPPVLATIRGQLANPQGYAAGANMRVAILWGGADTIGGLRTSQDVPVQPVFPSQFRLDLRSLPPLEAMRAPGEDESKKTPPSCAPGWDPSSGKPQPAPTDTCDDPAAPPLPGGGPSPTPAPPAPSGGLQPQNHSDDFRPAKPGDPFRLAIGTLVAYEDLNGNGKLDLLDDKATTAIDRIVGANEDLYVVYTEGVATGDFAELGIPKGFSQVVIHKCESFDVTPTDVGGVATEEASPTTLPPDGGTQPVPMPTRNECEDRPTVQSLDTLFTLPLTASPKLSEFMCRGEGANLGVAVASPPPVAAQNPDSNYYPAANDPKLLCKADGTAYTYTPCESSQNLCGDRITCYSATVARPNPTPAAWPCPSP